MRIPKEIHGSFECSECKRGAVAKVWKKYPSRNTAPRFVCGYHLRPCRTSEFVTVPVIAPAKPRKIPLGYAPEGI